MAQSSRLFKPFPEEKARTELIDTIAVALASNIGKTRQSGHNVIFASISLRASSGHAEYATLALVAGFEKLIRSFNDQHPGRG